MKIIYATDIDRTLIFSHKFVEEYKPDCIYSAVEKIDNKEISYMSADVLKRLHKLNENKSIEIIPVTTRSIDEYNRIDLGIKPKFVIAACGGVILENGEPIKEYDAVITADINAVELLQAGMDLSELKSVQRDSKYIENKYIFTKTNNTKLFDEEIAPLIYAYTSLNFTRQRDKVYVIPKSFSKGVALRWLTHYIGADTVVATGDGELDLAMLATADYAVIPKHGDLIKEGYIEGGRIAEAEINSPLYTMDLVEQILNENKA